LLREIVHLPSAVDNFKRATGTFKISRLLYNALTAHTYALALSRPQYKKHWQQQER
jgi:hypothetical protein